MSSKLKKLFEYIPGLLIVICIYFVFAPYLPQLMYKPVTEEVPASGVFSPYTNEEKVLGSQAPRLAIPKIKVEAPILEGQNESVLDKGIWHRPQSSDSPLEGNYVLTGHRYQYISGPRTFYFLNKLQKNDPIFILWKGETLEYRVSKVFTVKPDALTIEAPTSDRLLTLYTCTPLWSNAHRLVVQAKPVDPQPRL